MLFIMNNTAPNMCLYTVVGWRHFNTTLEEPMVKYSETVLTTCSTVSSSKAAIVSVYKLRKLANTTDPSLFCFLISGYQPVTVYIYY